MAKLIDHQPIRFNYTTECNLVAHDWKQFQQWGDTAKFQMEMEVCPTEQNAVKNGGFNTTSDWTIAGSTFAINTSLGRAIKSTGGAANINQPIGSTDGILWRVIVDINITSGTFNVGLGTTVHNITSSGNYEFWIIADTVTILQIYGDGASSGYVSNVSAVPANDNFEVAIINEAGTTVHTITNADSEMSFVGGFLTVSIPWQTIVGGGIDGGCYTLNVSDPCHCQQGGFPAQDFKTGTDEWYVYSGNQDWVFDELVGVPVIEFNPSGASTSLIEHAFIGCNGTSYDVTYTIAGMVAGDTFQVRLGGATGTTRTTSGTYTESIVALNNQNIKFYGTSTGATNYNVSAFSVVATTRTNQFVSVPIKLSETAIDCTYMINFCCNQDNMGFGFTGTGFSPSVRLAAQYAHGAMTNDRNSYEYSTGRKATTYYRGRKNKSLKFIAPSYIHDALMHMGGYDHAYIDGNEIFVEDDEYPSISWNDQTDLGGVTLTLRDKQVLIENRIISNDQKGCNINGNPVLLQPIDGGGGVVWVDPETGEIIIRG